MRVRGDGVIMKFNEPERMKFDKDKPVYSLIDLHAHRELAGILTYGAIKYEPQSWRTLADARDAYRSAYCRHEYLRFGAEELVDAESSFLHSAQMACNAHFLAALDLAEYAELRANFDERLKAGLATARRMRAERLAKKA